MKSLSLPIALLALAAATANSQAAATANSQAAATANSQAAATANSQAAATANSQAAPDPHPTPTPRAAPAPRTTADPKYQDLAHAVMQDQVAAVRALLDRGLDPNARVLLAKEDLWIGQNGEDPAPPLLSLAARFGSPGSEIVRLLLDRGARPDARDRNGQTPLMKAAELGWMPSMEPLMKRGADVNAKDREGVTVLMHAMGNRNLNAVAALIDKGAKVNARDHHGRTPLMVAVERAVHDPVRLYGQPDRPDESKARYLELIRFLLDRGADPTLKDKTGATAVKRARDLRQMEAAEILEKAPRPNPSPKAATAPAETYPLLSCVILPSSG
jgi:ankyrin repeat protein